MQAVMNSHFFELCADSVMAARAAQTGGATRIELCSDLARGGVTPSAELMAGAIAATSLPVYVLVRPRAGDFVYSQAEFSEMKRQIEAAKQAGARGVALGVLLADGRVDVERTRELVRLARPMGVTFHRAFDETTDLDAALEDVIATGADSLLTSGGAADVLSGAVKIGELARRSAGRIRVIAGAGLRLGNLAEVVRRSGVASLHGSLKRENGASGENIEVLEGNLREALRLLQEESRKNALAS